MKLKLAFVFLAFTLAGAAPGPVLRHAAPFAAAEKPNILLVMADDLGFSDLGCYGSEIETPHLDRLAASGLRMTQFYNTAKCHSSRVSLLTGRWCRQAGDERMDRAVTIPELLAPAGYFTAMTGKWHLAKEPTDFGFQRYFGHLSGATSYFLGDNSFRLNGRPWPVPAKGFYTTTANVDHAIRFLGEARAERKPWFLYLAFNAPHAPLQALEADYKKYLGRYDKGWDAIRAARVAKQQKLGLFPANLPLPPRPDHVRAWDQLPPARQAWEARRMAAYAALIDRLDQEMGRLLADLERAGELDNTLVLFVSDNGACPYDRGPPEPHKEPYLPATRWSDSTGWAWARNAPFRFYKQNQFEGGIATPAILHWPAGLKTRPGALNDTPAHLVDVLPTLAELAGASIPDAFPGREPTPLAGVSLAPLLAGKTLAGRPPIHFLYGSDRALRDGDWKLVSFRGQPWELYHIPPDRAETRNLAAAHPEIVGRLSALWHEQTLHVLKAPPQENRPVATETGPQRHREWTDFDKPLPSAGETAAPAATLQLGAPFADNAVFQQGIPLPIWGTAGPGAKIEAAFAGQIKSATADAEGKWRITLDPLKATRLKSVNDQPEGHALTITSNLEGGKAARELRNIAIGDVWICAGQSNMAGSIRTPVSAKNHPPDTVAAAHYPGMRFLKVEQQAWDVCTPETVLGCSRVAFFFARRVQQDARVPIGLIVRAVGGSNIESWLNQEPHPVGGNYAKLMTPVAGYGIRGAIWYQGESNAKDGLAYRPKLESLITGWRTAWGQGEFPFHFVQLPGIDESPADNPAMGDGRAAIRQAIFETLALPNTGMAVTIDVGTRGEHPENKYDTAERLARSVLQKVYGLENITACPLYKGHKVEGNTLRISFTEDAQGGLMIAKKAASLPAAFAPPAPTPGAKLQWLSIQDEGGQWHWADAKIEGAELIVSAGGVAKPIAVRYAYTTQPLGHLLYNKAGMPVGPFSTGGHDKAPDTKPQAPNPFTSPLD